MGPNASDPRASEAQKERDKERKKEESYFI